MRKSAITGVLSLALLLTLTGGSALATTTHPFLEYITTASGGNVQPEAVDSEGNLIVFEAQQRVVAKFDTNGNPVNFSGLGTNEIDGKGGTNCPATPADCDRVPTNGFGEGTGSEGARFVAVDNSNGPASGYIYVANDSREPQCQCGTTGEVDVFNSAGVFKGTIDQNQTGPDVQGNEAATIWVDSEGVLYIVHWNFGGNSHVDRYVPIDGNPAHDQFSGQLRVREGAFYGVAASPTYAYVFGRDFEHPSAYYLRYKQIEFHHQSASEYSIPDEFPPEPAIFGPSFGLGPGNTPMSVVYVDETPEEHVYVGGGCCGSGLREYDSDNHQIGPIFGVEHIGEGVQAIAIDRSGGPNEGKIYIHGPVSNKIAVFAPPAVIPDINNITAEAGHTTAHLAAELDLGGGPPATECKVEYGTSIDVYGHYEFSAPCEPATPYGSNTEVSLDLSGLAVEGHYHYRFTATNENGRNTTPDHEFVPHAVLGVSTDPASDLTKTSAKLNGSLNADGLETHYRFEYGISTVYNNKTELLDAGSGTGEEPVSPIEITGLQAGRTYHYRIVATNSYGKTKGPDETFIVPSSPKISGLRTTNLTETSVDLNARIDPVSSPTTYHFEYGLTPQYGLSTPELPLGSAEGIQAVTEHVSELQPGVTYHYRVVATNEWGTSRSADSDFSFLAPTCPNAHVRQQTNATYLPDCRAYELVSPGTAGSVTFFPGNVTQGNFFAELLGTRAPNAAGLASNPPRFGFFGSMGSVLGMQTPNALLDRYVATRTSSGWKTTYPGMKGNEGLLVLNPQCSSSLSQCVDTPVNPFAECCEFPNTRGLWDVSGEFESRLPTNLGVIPNGESFKGATQLAGDFSHFVFSSRNVAFAPGGLEAAPGSAYDNNISNGSVTIISKLQNGDPIPQDAGLSNEYIKVPYVSEDGSHVVLSTVGPGGTEDLYLVVDDAITYEIGQGNFVGATSAGSKIAFTSPDDLVPADTDTSVDMYEWNEASTPHLAVLSQGNGNGNSDNCISSFGSNCDVKAVTTKRPDIDNSVAAKSGDVYFYSPEQLDPENPGVKNERNLYAYHDGHVKYVTTFDPGTQADRMNVSPTGDHMAFLSRTQATGYVNVSLDNGMPKDSQQPQAWEEMYTYDANTGGLLCASCIPSGEPPKIPTLDEGQNPIRSNKDVMASQSGRFMSNDGRVAFATADSLVPFDTNGLIDVYEFTDNRPQLITSGSGNRDTQGGGIFNPTVHTGLEAFSQDGKDLYFSTFETLVPEDLNGPFVKFYDARTNGGFPIQPPNLPCTAADECHGDSSSEPSEPSFATSAQLGTQHTATPKKKRKAKAGRKRRRRRHRNRAGRSHG